MISVCFLFCLQNNFFYNTFLIFAILCVNTPFPHAFITFFEMCTFLRISLHYICGAQKIRPAFGSEQVLYTYFAYLRYCTVPDCHSPAIDSARCRSMIYSLFPARHTLLSHAASGENVGRKLLPPVIQRDITPVLSDDAALFFVIKRR